jgi:hypothetical protein
MLYEEVVEERGDVEEDGLGVEEEFGEEREVLRVQLGGRGVSSYYIQAMSCWEAFHMFIRTLCSSPSIL